MAFPPDAQAVTTDEFGPRAPSRMDTSPEAMLMMSIGITNGLTRFGPLTTRVVCWSSSVLNPQMPLPMITPMRAGSSRAMSSLASAKACTAAATANCANRSVRRASFLSITVVGSQALISPATRVAYPDASNSVTGPMPERPACSDAHSSATVFPTGVMTPIPVMTTRWGVPRMLMGCSRRLGSTALGFDLLLHVLGRLGHGTDLLGVLVGNLDVEFLLERHDQLHRVQRIRAQVLDEPGGGHDLRRVDAELIHDNLLHFFFDRHCEPPQFESTDCRCLNVNKTGRPSLHRQTAVDLDDLARDIGRLGGRRKTAAPVMSSGSPNRPSGM